MQRSMSVLLRGLVFVAVADPGDAIIRVELWIYRAFVVAGDYTADTLTMSLLDDRRAGGGGVMERIPAAWLSAPKRPRDPHPVPPTSPHRLCVAPMMDWTEILIISTS